MGNKRSRNHTPPGRSFEDVRREREGRARHQWEAEYRNSVDKFNPPTPKPTATQQMLRQEEAFRERIMRLLHEFRDALFAGDKPLAKGIELTLNQHGYSVKPDWETNEIVLHQRAGGDFDKSRQLLEAYGHDHRAMRGLVVPEDRPDPETQREARRRLEEFNRKLPSEHPWFAGPQPFEAKAAPEEPIIPPKLRPPGVDQSLEFLANDFLDALDSEGEDL